MTKQDKSSGTRERVPVHHRINRAIANAPQEEKHLIQLAVNEAEALAWQTGLPDLVFLTLAEEKLDALNGWLARQRSVRARGTQWSLSE